MISKVSRAQMRQKKHRRLRHHLNGTATTPRLAVFRSNKHMYAQIIDDTVGKTLVSASTLQKEVKAELEKTNDVEAAAYLGTVIGKKAVEAGIDYVKANHLEVVDGVLTGKVYGEIVTKDVKVAKLKDWASENGLELSQTIAMGDGANDLPMIKTAGIGIAFCAKPIVREQAPYQITEPDLYKVIEILDEVKK